MTEENSTDNTQVYGPNNAQGNSTDNIDPTRVRIEGHLVAEGLFPWPSNMQEEIAMRIHINKRSAYFFSKEIDIQSEWLGEAWL